MTGSLSNSGKEEDVVIYGRELPECLLEKWKHFRGHPHFLLVLRNYLTRVFQFFPSTADISEGIPVRLTTFYLTAAVFRFRTYMNKT